MLQFLAFYARRKNTSKRAKNCVRLLKEIHVKRNNRQFMKSGYQNTFQGRLRQHRNPEQFADL